MIIISSRWRLLNLDRFEDRVPWFLKEFPKYIVLFDMPLSKFLKLTAKVSQPSWLDTGFSYQFLVKHNNINYSSKKDISVLNTNKMCKDDKIIKCISHRYLCTAVLISFCPNVTKMWHLLHLYTWVLDHIKFCTVVLNIFKVNMEFCIYSAYLKFYLK